MELQDPAPITSASPEILPFKLLPLFFLMKYSDICVLLAMYVKRGSLSCISGGEVLKLLTDILWKVALKDFFKTNYLFLILKKHCVISVFGLLLNSLIERGKYKNDSLMTYFSIFI